MRTPGAFGDKLSMSHDYEAVEKTVAEPVRGRSLLARFDPAENSPRRNALRLRSGNVELRRGSHRHRRVTAHASRHSAHDGEGEGKRGLGMGFHRVNYTISAALCVGFRGRFPWPRKVSVVRREQIRMLNQNRRGLSTFQPFNFSTGEAQLFNLFNCRARCRARCREIQSHSSKHIQ